MSERTPVGIENQEEDIVDQAERVIKSLTFIKNKPALKTNQIRKFLSAVMSIRNHVIAVRGADKAKKAASEVNNKEEDLNEDIVLEIKMLKPTIYYQAGRNKFVNEFVEKSEIISKINAVGKDYKKFDLLCKYVEALVAFHKYKGGE
ncbi:type III-A CRISPR-associated protein Csm2 [uncultured Megasphaera sp.]|jgi:CRISPR-associated protein Csm2|uniref:type III-A CRISPR-associated protein Csm2 n=1 Tax=uncultured Megasphaera sp. TaxID=165188 RepID=UPI002592D4BF|nr:type III-A CRISPR-associated protein Csm2 [uncultured Megasphaera sp.]